MYQKILGGAPGLSCQGPVRAVRCGDRAGAGVLCVCIETPRYSQLPAAHVAHTIHTMEPRIAEAIAGLIVVVTVLLSAVPELAAAAATTTAAAAAAAGRQHDQQRSVPAAATSTARSVLAWGRWDQKRSQDPVAPRTEGVANNNTLLLDDKRRQATVARSQEQSLDRSWTHAAFRAFHEMRAGSPPAASGGDRVDGAGQGEGTGMLVGVTRFASRKKQRKTSGNDSTTAAKEEEEEGGGGGGGGGGLPSGKTRPTPPAACWHMKGRLTDTATGQTIALVEGVELARSLAFETASSRKAAKADERAKRLRSSKVAAGDKTVVVPVAAATGAATAEGEGELEVDKVLKPGLWTAFGALACSKFFMYQARIQYSST